MTLLFTSPSYMTMARKWSLFIVKWTYLHLSCAIVALPVTQPDSYCFLLLSFFFFFWFYYTNQTTCSPNPLTEPGIYYIYWEWRIWEGKCVKPSLIMLFNIIYVWWNECHWFAVSTLAPPPLMGPLLPDPMCIFPLTPENPIMLVEKGLLLLCLSTLAWWWVGLVQWGIQSTFLWMSDAFFLSFFFHSFFFSPLQLHLHMCTTCLLTHGLLFFFLSFLSALYQGRRGIEMMQWL